MDFQSRDLPEYPGSSKPALKQDFASLREFARQIGIRVEHDGVGSFFSWEDKLINIDTKTPNQRGFVSLGQLTDEYLHAWNQHFGRGKFLDPKAAAEHQAFGRAAMQSGTRSLGSNQNVAFHKLEALNFIQSGHHAPGFVWRVPMEELRRFAFAWQVHFQ